DIPNFMTSGHIHYSNVGDYKGIKLLSSSCWQAITPFQEKVGHNPDPGKIPMINLKDGSVKLLQF
ncbi:MAG: DNA polymerase II small subunit, partial [Nanoarchaeota archaeon]